jgi:F-type H+-transporting ATPase subunit delta
MSGLATRYARALADLATDGAQLEEWGAELERLAELAAAPEARMLFETPELSHQARIETIGRIAERLKLSFPLRSFAVVLARHRRLAALPAIAEAYRELTDQRLGRARATLTFALPPDGDELARVVEGLAAIARRTIIPTVKVEGALLGGVVAELEGKTYDGSLATMIAEAERRLAE